jgi:hypothetical protein
MSTNNKSKLRKDFESSLVYGALTTIGLTAANHFTASATPIELATDAAFYLPVFTGLMTGYKQFIERKGPGPDGPQ